MSNVFVFFISSRVSSKMTSSQALQRIPGEEFDTPFIAVTKTDEHASVARFPPDVGKIIIQRLAASLPVAFSAATVNNSPFSNTDVNLTTPINTSPVFAGIITEDDNEITTATQLCEILRSRGLGDPTAMTSSVTSSPSASNKSGRRGGHRRLPTPTPMPPAELVRNVERVQAIPHLVDVLRQSAVGQAEEARQRGHEFIRRIEAEYRVQRQQADALAALKRSQSEKSSAVLEKLSTETDAETPAMVE